MSPPAAFFTLHRDLPREEPGADGLALAGMPEDAPQGGGLRHRAPGGIACSLTVAAPA
ncbi:hypothetical protein [Frigidibacter sp. ROC022]|uniref:hypothetical protein n=1 Tax=Frigidibacter sp. ROC022 TaxID=2971796 RepID=UPI00215A3F80|nr:hypothetical protein [Frigidibacter sp. ROC022]MCR8723259.1 hypothetical protein [Frigidibacter sp. ROC022]